MPAIQSETLLKPTPSEKGGRINYQAMMFYLGQKYGFNPSDFFNSHAYYNVWCAKHGLKANDPDIKKHQQNFANYSSAADGAAQEPEYANFGHWMLDLQRGDSNVYKRMTSMSLNIPKVLATYDNDNRARQEQEAARQKAALLVVSELLPANLRQMAIQQNQPQEAGLRPFVRTILGYIQDEFGPVVKLSFA